MTTIIVIACVAIASPFVGCGLAFLYLTYLTERAR